MLPLSAALVAYWAAALGNRRRRPWPWSRLLLWTAGIAVCLGSVSGSLAKLASHSFPAHMAGHVLLGMLAPLLLTLAAPVTLTLRTLPVTLARRLVRLLAHPLLRCLSAPLPAAMLSLGGLWVLYRTPLYAVTVTSPLAHGLVHAHVLLSGCLLTAAIIGVDPNPYRRGYPERAAVLVGAMAVHAILAKVIYASPPLGVSAQDAELGAMIMYYAGDLVEVMVLIVLCRRWLLGGRRWLLGGRRWVSAGQTGRVSGAAERRAEGWTPPAPSRCDRRLNGQVLRSTCSARRADGQPTPGSDERRRRRTRRGLLREWRTLTWNPPI